MIATLAVVVSASAIAADGGPDDEAPSPFAKLEPMIGGWKGTARPAVNRIRGWTETHNWSWKFVKGKPVGITLTIQGGKVFSKADLSYDAAAKRYKLASLDAKNKPITFVGAATTDGKGLILDRLEATPEGKERLTIRPAGSGIRYTMLLDRQAPGAPQYKNAIEVGLTKDGESFAAGGAGGSDAPKCIITGGSASMTVSHEGKSYPICCTGCRDEFNDNPAKYIAKLAAKAAAEPEKAAAKPKPASTRGSGEFDGLIEAPPEKGKPKS